MKLNVSLYIPVYNGESTIESVLKSALKLSPAPNEIIVVNDGSSDGTKKILESYLSLVKKRLKRNMSKKPSFQPNSFNT